MKHFFLLNIIIAALFTSNIFSQAPQKFNYQGVARSTSGSPLANQNISLRITILDGTPGTAVYSESFLTKTNAFGLYVVNIGAGNVISGVFANINWSTGNKFSKVEIDPAGGSAFVELGTTPLLSVPFALEANDASKVTLFASGTQNLNKMAIQHSPAYPNWGLQYKDTADIFTFLSNGTSVLDINLGSQSVKVNKPLAIVDGTQGDGKVLTSDVNGNAKWLTPNFTADKVMMFSGGTQNPNKMIIQHSPAYPTWGLQYNDTTDTFKYLWNGSSVLDISNKVAVNTGFTIKDGTQGLNKVLTSDANGVATWQDNKIVLFNSGTANPTKMVIQHSPAYPGWGLQYNDTTDTYKFLWNNASVLDIGSTVAVNTTLSVKDGTQGANKVLTSDANGNASWQDFTTKISAIQPVGCQKLDAVTTSYQKIADLGTFTKTLAGTYLELNWQSNVMVNAFAGGATGAIYELRVDNTATTIGNATALFRSTLATEYLPVNITGLFNGLSAGTHTASVWVKTVYGSATGAYFDPGCFNSFGTNTLLIKEFK